MKLVRSAALALALLAMALPLSAQDDPKGEKAPKAEKKDEKSEKKDEKSDKKDDEKSDKKDEKLQETEYYPLAVGTTWIFEGSGQTIKVRIAEHEVVRGVLCARVETETPAGSASEHVYVKDDGVYRCSYNGVKIDPPVCFLKLPPKKGESWKVKSKQGAITLKGKFTSDEEDDVDVPAGTFKTVKVSGEFEAGGQDFTTTCWFAIGKGMVKQEMSVGGQNFALELKRFKKGTGKVKDDDDDDSDEKKGDEKKPEGKKDEKKPEEKKGEERPGKRDF